MGYPTALAQAAQSGPPVAQDPLSNVLAQALQQCEEVEERVKQLRDRLQLGPAQNIKTAHAEIPTQGIVSQANALRNVSSRLQALCSELETML